MPAEFRCVVHARPLKGHLMWLNFGIAKSDILIRISFTTADCQLYS